MKMQYKNVLIKPKTELLARLHNYPQRSLQGGLLPSSFLIDTGMIYPLPES